MNYTQRRNSEVHKAIIEATKQILDESGYAGLTYEAVAKRSGAGRPTLYRWWPNKVDLLIEVFNDITATPLNVPNELNVERALQMWFDELWNMWKSTAARAAYRSLLAESQLHTRAHDVFMDAFVRQRRRVLKQLFDGALSRNEISATDTSQLVDICWGYSWYCILTDKKPSKNEIQSFVKLICR